MNRRLSQIFSALFVTLVALSTALANDAAKMSEALVNTAKKMKMPMYERTLPNNVKRIYVNPQGNHLQAMEQTLSNKSDVLEIMHMGTADANHTLALFDRELLHSQYSNTGHWRLRTWDNRLRPSKTKLFSAMISLTPIEAKNLRDRINAGFAEEGLEENAGANWEHGHLGMSLGVQRLNCVATWSEMPIGEHGETLAQIVGLRQSYSGQPKAFQLALENEANSRVFGIGVYGPEVPGFGTVPTAGQTFQ